MFAVQIRHASHGLAHGFTRWHRGAAHLSSEVTLHGPGRIGVDELAMKPAELLRVLADQRARENDLVNDASMLGMKLVRAQRVAAGQPC